MNLIFNWRETLQFAETIVRETKGHWKQHEFRLFAIVRFWWYNKNTVKFDVYSFGCQKGNQRRMKEVRRKKRGKRDRYVRRNGQRERFGLLKEWLVKEENVISSMFNVGSSSVIEHPLRRLYWHPLCGPLLSALVFINGVTCSWFLRRWNVLTEKCNSCQ